MFLKKSGMNIQESYVKMETLSNLSVDQRFIVYIIPTLGTLRQTVICDIGSYK